MTRSSFALADRKEKPFKPCATNAANAFRQFTNTGKITELIERGRVGGVAKNKNKIKAKRMLNTENMCAKPSNVIARAALIELPVGANYSAMCTQPWLSVRKAGESAAGRGSAWHSRQEGATQTACQQVLPRDRLGSPRLKTAIGMG